VLREARKRQGLSQEKLADVTNFDRTYISLMERGVQSPTVRTLFRLAEALEIRASELVRRTETLLSPSPRR
jgi:transcriptional regulator with XRE-family HTH domain